MNENSWMVSEEEAWKWSTGNSMWSGNQKLKYVADQAQKKLLEQLIEDAFHLYEDVGEKDFNFAWYIKDTLEVMLEQISDGNKSRN